MKFNNIDELMDYTKKIVGKKFSEFDNSDKLNNGLKDKGILGKIIETGFYNYPNNNVAEADFNNLGVELKVSGYIKNKNGTISAKERLVLGKINYNEIIEEEFNYSKLLFKNKKILILWYEYEDDKPISEFEIKKYQLYDMSGDEIIIKNDYEIIKEKVVKGLAHILSEGDTSYLGACTKGATSKDRTSQPNSDIMAKPRAFSLKNGYMTGILRSSILALNVDNIQYKTIEEYVFAQINKFIGMTQLDILYKLENKRYEKKIPKNLGKMISDRVVGKDKELAKKHDLFKKTTYIIKNLPVNKDYYPLERMSFRNLNLSDFKKNWEESSWKIFFEEVTLIVLCYEGNGKIKNGLRVLKDMKKVTFTADEIDLFGRTYTMMKKTIESKDIKNLPIPKSFDGQIIEVAPKNIKNANAYNVDFNTDKTKLCFMVSKGFLFKKLTEMQDL